MNASNAQLLKQSGFGLNATVFFVALQINNGAYAVFGDFFTHDPGRKGAATVQYSTSHDCKAPVQNHLLDIKTTAQRCCKNNAEGDDIPRHKRKRLLLTFYEIVSADFTPPQ
jgi:hypothetical protein